MDLFKEEKNKDCDGGIFGHLFGHDIVDVYDTEERMPNKFNVGSNSDPYGTAAIISEMKTKTKTYVRSYCARCGITIERNE